MELSSLALEACVGGNGTYFSWIPRDIVSLIDTYINGPVRLDVIQYTDLDVWDRYEDRVLLLNEDILRLCNMRGEILAQRERSQEHHLLAVVSREEVLILYTHTLTYSLYNLISDESRDLEEHDNPPPDGAIAIRMYSLSTLYYDGALYSCTGPDWFLIKRGFASEMIKIGKNPRAIPVPSGVHSVAYNSPELTIFHKLGSCDFEFCGHKIEGVNCIRGARDGVIYIDSERKLRYMDRNGISSGIGYNYDVLSVDIFGTYMFVQLFPSEVYADNPLQFFARLRT